MIISKIQGGLGNQMFQYAAGLALAQRYNTELVLEVTWYDDRRAAGDTSRPFMLDVFKVSYRTTSPAELKSVRMLDNPLAWKRSLGRILWPALPKLTPFREQGHEYNSSFSEATDNTYLSGWWQTEKYFTHVSKLIRDDFAFKSPPDKHNQLVLVDINKSESVSVHVRRGDYANNPETNEFHGLTGLDYYHSATDYVLKTVKNPTFFVFSDESEWCKANLKFDHPTRYIDFNAGDHDYEDLRLMSACKHNIIANSSFSWWGAWLNSNPTKVVVGPKQWFQDGSLNTKDVLPESWIKL